MENFSAFGLVVARIIFGLFYVITAAGLTKDFNSVVGLMEIKGVPLQALFLGITIVVWIVCGGALIFGWGVVPAALVLMLLTAIITPIIHNFWAVAPQDVPNELQHFANNIAIIAGLLAIAAAT